MTENIKWDIRQLSPGPVADVANGLSPPAAEQPRSGTQAAENKMSFETLMRAIKVPSLTS